MNINDTDPEDIARLAEAEAQRNADDPPPAGISREDAIDEIAADGNDYTRDEIGKALDKIASRGDGTHAGKDSAGNPLYSTDDIDDAEGYLESPA